MKKTTKKAEKKQEFTQEEAEKFYKEHVAEMTATMLELGARKDKVLADEPQAMMRYFDMTEEQAVEFVNNMRTTAACVTGTGETTTRTNDVQATVTETVAPRYVRASELWDDATPVAKYINDDGWWIAIRKTADGKYLSQTKKEIGYYDMWDNGVEEMKEKLPKIYEDLTGRVLSPVCTNAIVDDIAQNDAWMVLEFRFSNLTPKDAGVKILKAYGLL